MSTDTVITVDLIESVEITVDPPPAVSITVSAPELTEITVGAPEITEITVSPPAVTEISVSPPPAHDISVTPPPDVTISLDFPAGPPGPAGPSVVSNDFGNIATLGSDRFIFVPAPDTETLSDLVDAKGDLLAGIANDTLSRLAVGTPGQVLTADSAASVGLKWATPVTGLSQSEADGRYVNVTGDSMTGTLYLPQLESTTKAPALLTSSSVVGDIWGGSVSRTLNVPTGVIAGDLLILVHTILGSSSVPPHPTGANGFSHMGNAGTYGALDLGSQIYGRVADASTVGGTPLTFTWAAASCNFLSMIAVRNTDKSSWVLKNPTKGVMTSPSDTSNLGSRIMLSMLMGAAGPNESQASNATNITGETPNVGVANPPGPGGGYDLVFHVAARLLANGQSIPSSTWTMPVYGFSFGAGNVFSLTLPAALASLPVDTVGGGVQFGGPVTLATSAPSQPLHAASKGYVDSLVAGISPAADFYRHSQPLMSSLWTVVHNLGRHPSVSAEDAVGNVMHGGVEYVSDDTLTISFSNAITGFANCT